jgi:hypothetical protein
LETREGVFEASALLLLHGQGQAQTGRINRFNGLHTLVKETLHQEPTSGFLFVFLNQRRERIS